MSTHSICFYGKLLFLFSTNILLDITSVLFFVDFFVDFTARSVAKRGIQ